MTHMKDLAFLAKQLRLPSIPLQSALLQEKAEQEKWSYSQYLAQTLQIELDHRQQRSIAIAIKASRLPRSKGLETFVFNASVSVSQAKIQRLASNPSWVKNSSNLIFFGASGLGKTHLASAIGFGLIQKGLRVYFSSATHLLQDLQRAKNDLKLEKALQKLDLFDVLIVDDLSYAKKSGPESSVLFDLVVHRYEFRSLMITANQPCSQWSELFPDRVISVAAIDRPICHCDIIYLEKDKAIEPLLPKKGTAPLHELTLVTSLKSQTPNRQR